MQKENAKAYATLQHHFADITGSNLDPATLAGGLFAAKIIGKARVDEASNPVWPNHQTKLTNILSEVMNSGKPGAFREFVLLILKMDQCVWLGDMLIETYKREGGVWVEIPPVSTTAGTQHGSANVSHMGDPETRGVIRRGDRPTMRDLKKFPQRNGKSINIPQQIGTKYSTFGIFLLDDDSGVIVSGIERAKMNDSEGINEAILMRWIGGEGQPCTWDALVTCLRDTELNVLASDIEKTLQ